MRWKGMNFVRAAIVDAGALLSAVAALLEETSAPVVSILVIVMEEKCSPFLGV